MKKQNKDKKNKDIETAIVSGQNPMPPSTPSSVTKVIKGIFLVNKPMELVNQQPIL